MAVLEPHSHNLLVWINARKTGKILAVGRNVVLLTTQENQPQPLPTRDHRLSPVS